jgi:hypothetical protein
MKYKPLATNPIARECLVHRVLNPPVAVQDTDSRQVEPVGGLKEKASRFNVLISPADLDHLRVAGA